MGSLAGKIFALGTALSCLTGFGIFRNGTFGAPHALGVVTLVVLAIAYTAERKAPFGAASRYVATLGYSAALFFHAIPGITETATRLPLAAPLATGPGDPLVQTGVGVAFALFLVGAAWQTRRLYVARRSAMAPVATPAA
jgi:hypothetical protein